MDDPAEAGFEVVGEAECLRLLAQETIGRVAVTVGAVPAVFPVNYRFADGHIYFRTGEGTKLAAAARNAVVAFEIDRIDRLYHTGWSVLTVGVAHVLTEPTDLQRAAQLPLRPWAPGARTHLVRIVPESVSGRRIVAGHDEPESWS
ncbi:MAG TPA: pyridoxamine 5'-phosphate oxidase family protein [Acidimicrobiales bacterium]|nr:pyridoxamine 5'-phosphate oxidase family protein [Acidimicrobiales bacterium]